MLPPAVTALLLQVTACLLVLLGLNLIEVKSEPLPLALLCGVFAMSLSYFSGLARWWLVIQLLFTPALVLMLSFDIPPVFFLSAFLIMLAVYWRTYQTQVPLYLSSNKVWHALESLLPLAQPNNRFNFIDLGSGLGGVLTHLARTRPDGHYVGVESAPLPLFWSWLRCMRYENCEVHWGSLWDSDLAQFDVVFAYLSPVPMTQLWHKARAEMRPGTVFISSTFTVPDHSPNERIQVDDLHHSNLLVWRM